MNGYLYCCGGHPNYLNQAIESAKSIRMIHPRSQICLFHLYDPETLSDFDLSVFNQLEVVSLPEDLPEEFSTVTRFFLARMIAISRTPYSRTLFLDSDTRIEKPIANLFEILDRFDIALAPGPVTQKAKGDKDPISEVPDCFPELNAGVILYRNSPAVTKLISDWIKTFSDVESGLYRKHGEGGDQVSLRYLLWKNKDISLHTLSTPGMPNLFNYRWPIEKDFQFDNRVKIWHSHSVANNRNSQSHSQNGRSNNPHQKAGK